MRCEELHGEGVVETGKEKKRQIIFFHLKLDAGAGCLAGWARRVGKHGVGDKKKLCFWQKRSPNCDFYGRSTFLSSRSLTSGSGMRGKADPNWVSKIFNCLRS
jgi:hypothetical protein